MNWRRIYTHRIYAAALALLSATGCQLGLEEFVPQKPEPTPLPPLAVLCGPEQAEQVVPLGCDYVPEVCQSRAQCCDERQRATSYETCVQEEMSTCREQILAHLDAGACFSADASARNKANGCNAGWVAILGQCTFPTAADYDSLGVCERIWSDGMREEGDLCTLFSSECAQPEDPGLKSHCGYENSESGSCQVIASLKEGDACEPGEDSFECDEELRCLSTEVCGAPLPLGSLCRFGDECKSNQCAGGTCTDPEVHGCLDAPCPVLLQCEDGACVPSPRISVCE